MSSNEPAESTPLSRLLVLLGRAFDHAGIEYMFFGGQAVLVYGEPRFTQAIDVTVGVDPYSSAVVLQVLAERGLVPLVEDVAEFLRQTFVLPVRDPTSGIRVDIVFAQSGYEQEALSRTNTIIIEAYPLRFISLEDLMIMKTVAGRPRDLEDVRGLIAKNRSFDRALVTHWLRAYDQELGESFEARFLSFADEFA